MFTERGRIQVLNLTVFEEVWMGPCGIETMRWWRVSIPHVHRSFTTFPWAQLASPHAPRSSSTECRLPFLSAQTPARLSPTDMCGTWKVTESSVTLSGADAFGTSSSPFAHSCWETIETRGLPTSGQYSIGESGAIQLNSCPNYPSSSSRGPPKSTASSFSSSTAISKFETRRGVVGVFENIICASSVPSILVSTIQHISSFPSSLHCGRRTMEVWHGNVLIQTRNFTFVSHSIVTKKCWFWQESGPRAYTRSTLHWIISYA